MDQETFQAWRRQEETQEFFRYLWQARLYAMEEWARRRLLSDNPEETRDANSMALVGIKVLDSMLEVSYDDIKHFYELTGGVGEFRYPDRREDADEGSQGLGAAGQAGPD